VSAETSEAVATAECAYWRCSEPAAPGSKYCSRRCCVRNAGDRRDARGRPPRTPTPGQIAAREAKLLVRAEKRRLLESPKGRPRVFDRAEALRLYQEPGATDASVAKLLGVSTSAIGLVRREAGVPRKPTLQRTPDALAAARADRVASDLRAGRGPFTTRDLEKRFSCSAYAAVLVMQKLKALGASVDFEPCTGIGGGVRLVVANRREWVAP
jgi:transposase-like protein